MQVQIAIESYDDLFSDFDIRQYEERYFSNDFLNELKMRTYKLINCKELEIKLVIPDNARQKGTEIIIEDRLKVFFVNRLERNKIKRRGVLLNTIIFEIIGLGFMFSATYLSKYITEYLKDFLLIPAWFFIWNGLEKYIYNKRNLTSKIRYYSKLKNAKIKFEGIMR